MSLMEALLKLNRVDGQLRGLRRRLDAAERYFNAQSRQHDEIRQRQTELETRKRGVEARVANLETGGAAVDEQLEKFRADLNAAVNNKQYSAVLTEMNTVKLERGKIDDAILERLDEVEQIDQELEEVRKQVDERRKVCEVARTQLEERRTDVGERLAELEAERDLAAADVPGEALGVFEEMARNYDGEAVAAVEEIDRRNREYACEACSMHIPFEQVAVLTASADQLVRCTACGRILYMQDEVRGALTPK
jgi:predicted  nucleic acid-binding Zn-ribbon protein